MNVGELIKAKPKEAAAAAGAVGVAILALVHRRRGAGGASATPAGSAAADTAGLSGIPNTLATDIQNAVQDQLNSFQGDVNEQISKIPRGPAGPPGPPAKTPAPKPKPKPKPPKPAPRPPAKTPAPKPGTKPPAAPWKTYRIPPGGTLYGAAAHIYGHATPANVAQLASWNGIRLYQRNGTTYADVHAGQAIKYR